MTIKIYNVGLNGVRLSKGLKRPQDLFLTSITSSEQPLRKLSAPLEGHGFYGMLSAGTSGNFFANINRHGEYMRVWEKGNSNAQIRDVNTYGNHVYIAGRGDTTQATGSFVMKMTPDGQTVWLTNIGIVPSQLSIDSSGIYALAGTAVYRLDHEGDIVWVKRLGQSGRTFTDVSMCLDTNSIYVVSNSSLSGGTSRVYSIYEIDKDQNPSGTAISVASHYTVGVSTQYNSPISGIKVIGNELVVYGVNGRIGNFNGTSEIFYDAYVTIVDKNTKSTIKSRNFRFGSDTIIRFGRIDDVIKANGKYYLTLRNNILIDGVDNTKTTIYELNDDNALTTSSTVSLLNTNLANAYTESVIGYDGFIFSAGRYGVYNVDPEDLNDVASLENHPDVKISTETPATINIATINLIPLATEWSGLGTASPVVTPFTYSEVSVDWTRSVYRPGIL